MILETKLELVNLKQEELLGIENLILGKLIVDLNEVCAIREAGEDDSTDIDPKKCAIYLKSGDYFTILTPFDEVKKLWIKS